MRARAASAIVAVVALASCAAAERPVLERFFGASRLRDTTALQSLATVIFEPHQQGIVRGFDIVAVGPVRQNGALAVKDVTVAAIVAMPDGRTVQKSLIVTLQRQPTGRVAWIVTAVRDAATSQLAPPL